jgi:hypothetical protein
MMSLMTPVAAPVFRSSEHRQQNYEPAKPKAADLCRRTGIDGLRMPGGDHD